MRKNLLSKVVGCAVALAVIVPALSVPIAASCPITNLLSNYIGQGSGGSNGIFSIIPNNNNSSCGNKGNCANNGTCNSNSGTCNSNSGSCANNGNNNANIISGNSNSNSNNNNIQSILNSLLQNGGGYYNNSNNNSNKANFGTAGSCGSNAGNCSANTNCPGGNCATNVNPPSSGICVGDGCAPVCENGECDDNNYNDGCGDYAQAILILVNAERKKAGVKALTLDSTLCKAADVRAAEIVQSFSHTRPNGKSFSTAVNGKYNTLGENIAAGYKTPQDVVNAWMSSAGHKANILNPNYTKIGVGYADPNGAYCCYWTQIFAS